MPCRFYLQKDKRKKKDNELIKFSLNVKTKNLRSELEVQAQFCLKKKKKKKEDEVIPNHVALRDHGIHFL